MIAPERIWARPDYNECWPKRLEEEDVEYIRADLAQPAPICPDCGNTGLRDTGGVYPWGEGIFVACDHDEPQPDPRDEVIARLVDALVTVNGITEASFPQATSAGDVAEIQKVARAALASAKAVHP